MTDVERIVWCAAYGEAIVNLRGLLISRLREEAKIEAAFAVELLGGPSRNLTPDAMMLAATAEPKR